MKLEEMKLIVTGGAQGMGRHFVQRLAEAGASVAVGDVQPEGLEAVKEACRGLPGKVFSKPLDVSKIAELKGFVDWASDAMGGLTGLVNNAGILRDGLMVRKDRETGEVVTLDEAAWHTTLAVNLTGATFMVRETVAKMIATDQKGVIVNMSSIARYGNRGQTSYAATKAAIAANTRTWSLEFARFGIRVGAVAPGMIETPMTQGMNQKARDALVHMVPVGRVGLPEDIWEAVKFIIACDYFTGRTIDVDGGLSM
ncbi:MAG: SDR family oxidoreductase [Deltaproteobacteria bacterium]|nr:SDR family oxidoreductase [Deltaproteobacteria bacterium]